ncbi:MAG: efflux RND transporter periplasmic adaptor subunit [Candidatus Krumholzibacteria bacterium]|jgi:HlyD family secretion protein|nr:efflux RND transporter periplasmic adaptor subunit [Candidatus Krumholzibacteria bacterium]
MDRPLLAASLALLLAGCSGRELPNPAGTFETTIVDVAPVISGRALVVQPVEGAAVAAGDTLIVLDTELLALQRAETAARRASIEAQRRTADADLAQTRRRLDLVETTLARTIELLGLGSATQQQVDDLTAERDVTRSAIEAARGRLAAYDAELAHLDAALAVLDRQLRDGVVQAPVGGVVLTRALEPGEVAAPGRMALRLADLAELELRVYLEAGDLDRVRLGDTLPVVVDALPDERCTGRVSWISEEAEFTPKNAQTRNARAQLVYAVKLRVANPERRLHVGMPAEVVLP